MSSNDVRQMIDAAVDAALSRLRPQLVDAVVASIPPPPPPAAPSSPAPAAGPAGAIAARPLRDDVFALVDGNGQVEILNVLMGAITKHWDRAVLFLVKANFQPWDARGFESGIGNDGVKAVAIPADADTILAASLTGSGAQSANSLLDKLGPARGVRAAVPLGIRSKAAAILYCDGPKGDMEVAVAAMEALARITAASIELGMLQKRTPPFVRSEAVTSSAATPAPAPAPVAEPAAPAASAFAWSAAEPEIEMEVEPEIEVEAEPAPAAPAPSFAAPPAPAPSFAAPPAPPAMAAMSPSPAAPAVETAPEPTGALSAEGGGTLDPRELLKGGAKPVVDAGQAMTGSKVSSRWKPVREQVKSGEALDPAMAAIPEADRGKHVEARKIARLLVSEIKLYNEAKVAVGRKNRDLYERLKEDIERSRQTYLQRIDPDVASKSNYFQDELVATLAEGDAEALGQAK